MRLATCLAAASVLCLLSQTVTAGVGPGPTSTPTIDATPAANATGRTAEVSWPRILRDLHLEFYDPDSLRTFTATGPYEILEESSDRVVALGASGSGADSPRLTIVAMDSGLWVFARFQRLEFATRID